MSRFIILFAFTVLLVGVVVAQTEKTVNGVNCFRKRIIKIDLKSSCRYSIEKYNEIPANFERYIVQFSGDNATINSWADEYCPIFKSITECELIPNEYDEECRTAIEKEQDQQDYSIDKGIINYLCIDSGAAIIKLLQNDGLQTVYNNDDYRECQFMLFTPADPKTVNKMRRNNITCESVNEAYKCYIDYVRNHANSNLVAIANDVRLIYREVLKCGPENEL